MKKWSLPIKNLSLTELHEKLHLWKTRLGLLDWDIQLKFSTSIDLDNAQGRTLVYDTTQTALIRLMHAEDRQASDPNDLDMEVDLVHELVHVRLWAIDPHHAEGALHICREQAVDWIAKGLVAADRQQERLNS